MRNYNNLEKVQSFPAWYSLEAVFKTSQDFLKEY